MAKKLKNDSNGWKLTLIWTLIGILQVIVLSLGGWSLLSNVSTASELKGVQTKQEMYDQDKKELKQDIRDLRTGMDAIKNFIIKNK